ncbi:MAG: AzlC family ABC transporter permease [Negativicutes bacterium]|nr:AzlC family ABC transporter permease [Negativicutes bacterium]
MIKTSDYLQGIKAGVPIILGIIPVGVAFAIMARQSGFSILETIMMSATVFAGASQMVSVNMYSQGADLLAIILATFVINLRHLIMSTCIMHKMKSDNVLMKALVSFGITDESFAIFTNLESEEATIGFFMGLISVTYSTWVLSTVLGAISVKLLPAIIANSLGISLYAMFIALLIPNVKSDFKLLYLMIFTGLLNLILVNIIGGSWAMILSTLIAASVGACLIEVRL